MEGVMTTTEPSDRLIGDDDCRARREGVIDLTGKLRVHAQPRRDLLGHYGATAARHAHPATGLFVWNQKAKSVGGAFEHRKDVVAERAASVDLDGSAADRTIVERRIQDDGGDGRYQKREETDFQCDRQARPLQWT